jgi:hypothetical protein
MATKKHTGWVRSSVPPDEIRVSFIVRKDEYPELVQWLWGLPYRRASTEVRGILNEAAKRVSIKPRRGATSTPSAPPTLVQPPPSAEPLEQCGVDQTATITQTSDAEPLLVPAASPLTEQPSSHQAPAPEMTAEVADLMRSYGRDF